MTEAQAQALIDLQAAILDELRRLRASQCGLDTRVMASLTSDQLAAWLNTGTLPT